MCLAFTGGANILTPMASAVHNYDRGAAVAVVSRLSSRNPSVGLDMIDLDAARRHGVTGAGRQA